MTDLSQTIIPKSDQINSDDLIGGPLTITIEKVSANPSTPEQPISISFCGDNGKPWKPCKSMRRVLVSVWGSNGAAFVGRSLTLYRDPTVKFGGFEVGGIRISHMSDIDKPVTMALTTTRASRKAYTVQPMPRQKEAATKADDPLREPDAETLDLARTAAKGGSDVFKTWWQGASKTERADVNTIKDEIARLRNEADAEQKARATEEEKETMP
jgi:hypothetical protein